MNKRMASLIAATGIAIAMAVPAARADMMAQTGAMPPAELVTNGPQASPGDNGNWSAQRNVAESSQYEHLLRANPGFRQARMHKECGPIDDPAMRQQCMATFQ